MVNKCTTLKQFAVELTVASGIAVGVMSLSKRLFCGQSKFRGFPNQNLRF